MQKKCFVAVELWKQILFCCRMKISFEFCRRETAIQYVLNHSWAWRLYCWPEQYPEDFLTRHLLKISIFDDRLVPQRGSFNNCVVKVSLFLATYLLVMSPSRAEGLSARLGLARGLFPSARKFYFSSKIEKLCFFSYFPCIFRKLLYF